mmetsp:Transcript_15714/g.44873  ORF Transcript_15714/g.44873 Transcript_15714/m.44873 type:complete len:316 (+) Transcript_15714:813-1760(+)
MRVHALYAVAHLLEVVAHGVESFDDIDGKGAGDVLLVDLPAVDGLRVVPEPPAAVPLVGAAGAAPLLQDLARPVDDLHAEVIAALATGVRDRVQLRNAGNEPPLRLLVLPPLSLRVQELQLALDGDGVDDDHPRLLLDLDQLADVPLLEARPGAVERHERRAQLVPVGPEAPAVEEVPEGHPGVLQGFGVLEGHLAELELVAVDPDRGLLVSARLQNVNAVMPGVVREEGPVVRGEAATVGPRRGLEAECGRAHLEAAQEEGPVVVQGLCPPRVGFVAKHRHSPVRREELLDCGSLRGAGDVPAWHAQSSEHGFR